jgi:hypothetical protein
VDDRVLIQTSHGVAALDASTGDPSWSHDVRDVLDTFCDVASGAILLVHCEPAGESLRQMRLVWIDARHGVEQNSIALDFWQHPHPVAGPFVVYGSRLWGFFGRSSTEAGREVLELVGTRDSR